MEEPNKVMLVAENLAIYDLGVNVEMMAASRMKR